MGKQNVFKKVGSLVTDFFKHWNTPPKEGYYLPNREFVAYAVGGMGVQGFGILTQYFAINVGVHLSLVYNFDAMIVQYTTWIIALLTLFRAPIVGWIIDNTNTKWGKYRPYLLFTGVLCVLSYWLLAFIPDWFMPDNALQHTAKTQWLVVGSYQLILFIATTIFSFFSFGRTGLAQVITPNTNERTKLYSVGGVIDSLGPSIVQMFFPLIAGGIYGQSGSVYGDEFGQMTSDQIRNMGLRLTYGMDNINTYKVVFPIVGLICVALSLVMFFGTKERIIQEKKVKEKIGFLAGIKKSMKNQYFWIFNISNILAFGRLLIFSATNYVCLYILGGQLGTAMRGIMPTLASVGFVPGMLFSPIIQKKLGKKNMTLLSFAGSTVISALLLILFKFAYHSSVTAWIYFVGVFCHNIFAALWTVTSPAMTADYCEYQQWKTGERLDGYMSQFSSVITTVCGMLSSWLTTTLLIKFAGAASAEDYGEEGVMQSVLIIWGILSIVCGVLAILPFLFWNLNEKKQLEMAKDIKIRGYKEQLESNTLAQENILEAVSLGVLTEEQALEMGFVLEETTNEDNAFSAGEQDQLTVDEATTDEVADGAEEKSDDDNKSE
ncbi:MAG: MFS transporter [Clostridia bacterium]|nr:MFS transporter [Clostridia bacterium]